MSVSDDDSREPEVGSASYCIRKRPKHYLGPNLSSPEIPIMLLRQALWLASDSARCGECTKVEVARAGRTIAVYYDAGLPTDEPDGTQIEFRLDRKLLQGNVYLDVYLDDAVAMLKEARPCVRLQRSQQTLILAMVEDVLRDGESSGSEPSA